MKFFFCGLKAVLFFIMKTKAQKREELAKIREEFSKAKITVFTSFAGIGEKGLSVGQMAELKKELRKNNSSYLVGKKSLVDRVVKNVNNTADVFQYPGSLGLAFGFGDIAATAKTLAGFAKKNHALKFFGALLGQKLIDVTAFNELAKLPSREVMIARLLGMMKYPISGLAVVLDQISKQKIKNQ